ncbi:HEAT repeat domain-containing protein [Streptomyces cellulosae]|uniref:HEAT repeat domain-containing protein n=1 Tax=Streptomyces cellulosae TaxID=1968 RepID=A0ABW7XUM8_STRCE
MFTGIDEVDWAALRHAHGSAEDVPGLLRGLASQDPAEREDALDRMYGTVHDQGTVYDSTLACVPFLLALAGDETVPERDGIVELLVSVGTVAQEAEGGPRRASGGAPGLVNGFGGSGAPAADVIRAGAEVFVRLAGDADAAVRRAAAGALVRFLDEPARVLGVLRERIAVERDDGVLLALTESLGLFVRRHPAYAGEALEPLVARSGPPYEPGLRLAALGQLVSCAHDRVPSDLVPLAVRLLRERSAGRTVRREKAHRSGKETLARRLHRLWPVDEEGSHLLRSLHTALDDRLADRTALLEGQLTSPDPTDRCNAVWMAAGLLREWRTDHTGPVTLIGHQLGEEDGRLSDAAVSVLMDLFGLAGPAADRLAALVASRPDRWVRRCRRGTPSLGGPLKALARCGDPRAVPVLAEVLAGPDVPGDLGPAIGHLGRAAAPLAPVVRRRLGAIPLGSPRAPELAVPLLSALLTLGDQDALPEVMRLVRGPSDGLRPAEGLRSDGLWSDGAYLGQVVSALGLFGAAARDAVPVLRALLDTEQASAAAGALWEVEGEAAVVLPVLSWEVAAGDRRRRQAVQVLSRMGPAARPASAALRRAVADGPVWERVAAACALWRIEGDAEPVLPVLRAGWTEHPHTRVTVAECLVGMGPAAAPLRDLPESELASRRRHLALPGGHGSHDIPEDERLVGLCRAALAGG